MCDSAAAAEEEEDKEEEEEGSKWIIGCLVSVFYA
jgi:hypothetical protein